MVKNLPAMQGTQVQSVGQEDPLEKETATHSSILAWKIPLTEKPGRLWYTWSQRDTIQQLTFHVYIQYVCMYVYMYVCVYIYSKMNITD